MGRIIGIDLGTSTSEVSCIVDGKPVIIPNDLGGRVTPSVVHIGENGETLVGEPAGEYLLTRPDCTFMEVKRSTGSDTLYTAHGRMYAPEEIQAMLLRYLAGCARDHLGEAIERAVITVPAYFNDKQRRATAKAGELAGLRVERIINEPTAAALDFGLQNMRERKYVLVYDLGGGTLDITVLELFDGVIEVKASSGDNRLGGKDFDEIIMGKLMDARTIQGDERAAMRLKKAAEACKIALSEGERYAVSLPFLCADKRGKPISLEREVTRAEFEGWIGARVASTRTPMMSALSDAGLTPAQLDIVLLVGGSTRIPCVRRFVADTLGQEPQALVDPDLAVALGAAVQAGILDGVFAQEDEPVLTDVCPYTLGTDVLREGLLGDTIVVDTIIPRNTAIPVERSKVYCTAYDYQTAVSVEVYQGDSTDPDENEHLGKVLLTGIRPARRGKEPIEVVFAYDLNGILQVSARSLDGGQEVTAQFNTAGVEPRPAIDLDKWEDAEGARRFRPAIRKAQRFIDAGADTADELELLVVRVKEALVLGNEDKAEGLREELLDLIEASE